MKLHVRQCHFLVTGTVETSRGNVLREVRALNPRLRLAGYRDPWMVAPGATRHSQGASE